MKSPFQTWLVRLAVLGVLPFFLSSCGSSYSAPTTTTYTIGGMVSGLSGTGLVLQDNGGNSLSVTANGNFTFTTAIASGGAYAVTVSTQPTNPAQNCTVTNGSSTATANVTNVQVSCTNASFKIGVTVSGLTGTGLALQDNGGDNLSITGNGPFTFATAVTSAYAVTVFSFPTGPVQNCVVTNGSGTASANVTVQVACTNGFTIGGTVANLASTGLILQNNAGNNLSVAQNGTFIFTEPVDAAGLYAVTVSTQPSNPAQTCEVTSGSGTANATVTHVTVDCSHNEWAWKGGSNSNANGNGNPGMYPATPGTTNATNLPGTRNFGATSWTDTSGNLWLFGGNGNDSTAMTVGDLNDLWKYNIASGEWTWVSGSPTADDNGSYGALNTPDPTNRPGARDSAVGWIDSSGNLWLFGGERFDAAGAVGYFNDLWEYSVANNGWIWMGGSNVPNQPGTYSATPMVAQAGLVPGARGFATVQNINGVVWLFGGFGNDSVTTPAPEQDNLDDVWQYTISTGAWMWMSGSKRIDEVANYGTTMGTTTPGSRYSPASWADTSGNLWLFGGSHLELDGSTVDYFNDLWEYSTVSNEWTWKGGQNTIDQKGNYGTQGTAAATNLPGARGDMSAWTDPSGNFWLFGGFGYDSTTPQPGVQFDLNDMWEYAVTTNEWTWQKGMNTGDQPGVYGTLGQLAPLNVPGNREGGASWTDASGNLWLFGGSGELGINDLWMYFP